MTVLALMTDDEIASYGADADSCFGALETARGVLPLVQEPLKQGRGDGLDFSAQLHQRRTMNSRQDAPVAPLNLADRITETSLQNQAFSLEADQCGFYFVFDQTECICQALRGGRTA